MKKKLLLIALLVFNIRAMDDPARRSYPYFLLNSCNTEEPNTTHEQAQFVMPALPRAAAAYHAQYAAQELDSLHQSASVPPTPQTPLAAQCLVRLNSDVPATSQTSLAADELISFTNLPRARRVEKGKYPCPLCRRSCASHAWLRTHMRIHTGQKPYECTYDGCDYAAAQKGTLADHVHACHTFDKPFKCTICPKAYVRKCHLQGHMIKIHTAEISFICSSRNLAADQNSNLGDCVQAKHTEVNLFKCPLCDHACAQESYLNSHMRTHIIEEQSFKCPLCDYKSALKSAITKHFVDAHSKPISSALTAISQTITAAADTNK